MNFLLKFVGKTILVSGILYIGNKYIDGFSLDGGIKTLLLSAFFLAILSAVLQPIFRFISAPLRWLTLGLFNIVIYMTILWIGDKLLPSLSILSWKGLFLTSVLLAITHAI